MSFTDWYATETHGMSRARLYDALMVERYGHAPRQANLRYEDDEYLAGAAA